MALTDKQQRFVEEYLADLSPADAYIRAGYQAADREVAISCANRLLRNAAILSAVDRLQVARLEKVNLDNDWIIGRFQLIYSKAVEDGDFTSAMRALENIAKHAGFYLEDNRQKTGTDIESSKARLREMGIDPDRLYLWKRSKELEAAKELNGVRHASNTE